MTASQAVQDWIVARVLEAVGTAEAEGRGHHHGTTDDIAAASLRSRQFAGENATKWLTPPR
jgi:hypothetical protein